MAFAYEGLRGAGGDQCALDGQDQSWAGVKIYVVVGLTDEQGEKLARPQARRKYMEKEPTSMCSEKAALAGNSSFYSAVYPLNKSMINMVIFMWF